MGWSRWRLSHGLYLVNQIRSAPQNLAVRRHQDQFEARACRKDCFSLADLSTLTMQIAVCVPILRFLLTRIFPVNFKSSLFRIPSFSSQHHPHKARSKWIQGPRTQLWLETGLVAVRPRRLEVPRRQNFLLQVLR